MSLQQISTEPPSPDTLVWQTVSVSGLGAGGSVAAVPKPRALHIGAVVEDAFYIHGGYDGMNRCADLWRFDFQESRWQQVVPVEGATPSARDRHACVVADRKLFVFGGYDGSNRVNDFWEYDPSKNKWSELSPALGRASEGAPSPRHSHCMFVYGRKIFVLFGYDGNYRNDLHAFDLDTWEWTSVATSPSRGGGVTPKPRYRNSATVVKDKLLVFGGHDGARHLGDAHVLNLQTMEWTELQASSASSSGAAGGGLLSAVCSPSARDSHSACLHSNGQVLIFGGSSGTARADLVAFDMEKRSWQEWKYTQDASGAQTPVARFCHVAVIYKNNLYVNSGYDGQTRLNDFKKLPLPDNVSVAVPEATVLNDLRSFVNNPKFSDIGFVLDGEKEVKAHRILLSRSPYFACMLNAEMQESIEGQIRLKDVSERVLVKLLEIIYTDEVYVEEEDMSFVLELLVAADRFAVDRLKAIAEIHIMKNINFDNAASIFQVADQHSALILRTKALEFILKHFDAVIKSKAFEDMAKNNVDLLLEIIKKR